MEIKKLEELEGKTIKIRWLQGITLDVCDHLDGEGEGVFERETFDKDEEIEVDVDSIDERNGEFFFDLQFGDGSMVTAVSSKLFSVV